MRNPLMDSDPTHRLGNGAVPAPQVAPATTLGEARRLLASTDADALVVAVDREPVGVITAHVLLDGESPLPATSTVADAMDYEAVRIDPAAGERDTMRAYVRAAWDSVLHRHPYRDRSAG
jgi:CBS domain-containing protein